MNMTMNANDGGEDNGGWIEIDLDGLDDYSEDKKATAKAQADEDEDDLVIVEDDADDEDEDEKPTQRKSRAQDRIQQLVAKEKETARELAEWKAKAAALEEQSFNKQKEFAETHKASIANQITSVKASLRRAREDDDLDAVMDLEEKLDNLRLDQRVVAAQASKVAPPAAKAKDEPEDKQTEATLPEEMRYWLEDNSWALKPKTDEDRKKVRAIRRLSKELLEEGYNEAESDFYSEIDSRLEKLFASEGGDGVKYKNKDTDSSSTDAKGRTKSPVSTSSRTPASRRTRVNLSPEERSIADKLNMDPKRYALRKQAREESKGDWTVIV